MAGLIGKKIGMTRIFNEEKGIVTPVTVVEAGPCPVVQVKTEETDGYDAVQLGFGEQKEHLTAKPALGRFKKAGIAKPMRHLKELSVEEGVFSFGIRSNIKPKHHCEYWDKHGKRVKP